MGVMLQVSPEGIWSCVHSVLQSGGESMDLEGLLPLFDYSGSWRHRSPNWLAMKSSLMKVTFLPGYSFSGSLPKLKMIPI
jgi:hypothetical protein